MRQQRLGAWDPRHSRLASPAQQASTTTGPHQHGLMQHQQQMAGTPSPGPPQCGLTLAAARCAAAHAASARQQQHHCNLFTLQSCSTATASAPRTTIQRQLLLRHATHHLSQQLQHSLATTQSLPMPLHQLLVQQAPTQQQQCYHQQQHMPAHTQAQKGPLASQSSAAAAVSPHSTCISCCSTLQPPGSATASSCSQSPLPAAAVMLMMKVLILSLCVPGSSS